MDVPMAAAIAVLFGAGTYLILRPNLIRMVMGFGLYSNATNLLMITAGGYTRESGAPFLTKEPASAQGLMDPLPPDIILTAIVISFAVSALLLIVCYRVYLDHGTDNPHEIPLESEDLSSAALAATPVSAAALGIGPPGGDHPSPRQRQERIHAEESREAEEPRP